MHVYIETSAKRKARSHHQRVAAQPAFERKIHFLILRDGSGFIQAVMSKAGGRRRDVQSRDHLSQETSVVVTGTRRCRHARAERLRDDVKTLEIIGASHDYPITQKSTRRHLLDRRHLWTAASDSRRFCACATRSSTAVRDFFNDRGSSCRIHRFHPAACEERRRSFPRMYFDDQTAYLTQSGQL